VFLFAPDSRILTFRQQHIMIYAVKRIARSQNIPPTVNMLLSASNITVQKINGSLKE
jgi:hypothetical protein